MQIDLKEIIEEGSSYVGKVLWISDFRREDLDKKSSRHVRPQKALLVSNDQVPHKRIYYSDNCFLGLNKSGEPAKSKIISVFDNTGFRSRTGVPIKVFDNEQECKDSYIAQAEEIKTRINERVESAKNHWIAEREEVDAEIKKYT
jgi:hypothetical protein